MALVALAVGGALASSAQAATYTVGTTEDLQGRARTHQPAPARCDS